VGLFGEEKNGEGAGTTLLLQKVLKPFKPLTKGDLKRRREGGEEGKGGLKLSGNGLDA